MSADGKRCECGKVAIAALRRPDERHDEPICGACLERITPNAWPPAPAREAA